MGMFVDHSTLLPFDADGSIPSDRLHNHEHAIICLALLVYAMAAFQLDRVRVRGRRALSLLLVAAVFAQEPLVLVFHFHSAAAADHTGFEGHFHWLLQHFVAACLATALLGLARRERNVTRSGVCVSYAHVGWHGAKVQEREPYLHISRSKSCAPAVGPPCGRDWLWSACAVQDATGSGFGRRASGAAHRGIGELTDVTCARIIPTGRSRPSPQQIPIAPAPIKKTDTAIIAHKYVDDAARTTLLRRDPHPSWTEARQPRHHPAGLIAERALANGVEDYLSFCAVCREWRRSAKGNATLRAQGCLDRRFYPRRWIMLRDAAPPGSSRRRFLNISTGECVHTELPELDGSRLLGATAEGLLALLDASTYAVRLLNPLTRQLAELPSLAPLRPAETHDDISRYALAYGLQVTGLGLASDATDVALCFHKPSVLVVAKPGDSNWTLVEGGERWFYSATSFSNRFYCADGSAVMALEPATAPVSLLCLDDVHLVEGNGKLFLLHRKIVPQRYPGDCWRRKYKVFRVDLDVQKTVTVRGLDGLAVFLGKQLALSVPSGVFPTIRANTVYLGFDLREWSGLEKVSAHCLLNGMTERCTFSRDDGWTRPCGISDYLSWYVSGICGGIEEI
ncbi:hypothetical protein EJB05_50105, partial [Eragrostis curvula]